MVQFPIIPQVRPLVYVALDYDGQKKNLDFARELAEGVSSDDYGFKINLDSFAYFHPDAWTPYAFVSEIRLLGRPVFLDLKMWNGGRTMSNIAKGCAELGVDIINMHAHAGERFIKRVAETLKGSGTKLFCVTVPTHYNDEDTRKETGKSLSDTVRMYATISRDGGADGIIVPGTQLEVLKDISLLKLCPGIRPVWYVDTKDNDQEQTVTPREAVEGRADYLVVGSPIRKSKNKAEALEKILSEVRGE